VALLEIVVCRRCEADAAVTAIAGEAIERRILATKATTTAGTAVARLTGRFMTNTLSGRAEAGRRYVMPSLGGVCVTPYIATQVTSV
jgi:hypothetical protein